MTTDWQSPEDANILASLLEAMDRVSSAIATTPTTAVMLDNHSTLSDEHREQLVECLRKARQVCQEHGKELGKVLTDEMGKDPETVRHTLSLVSSSKNSIPSTRISEKNTMDLPPVSQLIASADRSQTTVPSPGPSTFSSFPFETPSVLDQRPAALGYIRNCFYTLYQHLTALETKYTTQNRIQRFKTCEFFLERDPNDRKCLPICLKDMVNKMERGLYANLDDIKRDIDRMCDHAQHVHPQGTYAYNDALILRDETAKMLMQLQHSNGRKRVYSTTGKQPPNRFVAIRPAPTSSQSSKRARTHAGSFDGSDDHHKPDPGRVDATPPILHPASSSSHAIGHISLTTPPSSIPTSPLPSNPCRMDMDCIFCGRTRKDTRREIIFIPCSHILMCGACAELCDFCPKCGLKIQMRTQIMFNPTTSSSAPTSSTPVTPPSAKS